MSACGLIPITENFQALGGPDADLDAAAAITLGQIGPESRAAVPKLITQLRSHSEHGSTPYSLALGAIGPAARDAIPLLEELLHSDTPETRLAAADALSRIAPELSSNLVAVVQPFLAERDSGSPTNNSSTVPVAPDEWRRSRSLFLSLQASVILWRLHVQKDPPVAQIIDAFAINTEPWFIGLLGDIGPAAKAALPNILIPLVQPGSTDSDDQLLLRPAAAIAIRKIDPATATRLNLPGTLALP